MKYHYEKPQVYLSRYGTTYKCDHPLYNNCTLYTINQRGLAVIQQRFNSNEKITWWSEIDEWLTDDLYLHACFKDYFDNRATFSIDGLYPTVTIRQMMWAFKIKPIPRERWETCFDRKDI